MPKSTMFDKDIKDLNCSEAVIEAITTALAKHNIQFHEKDMNNAAIEDSGEVASHAQLVYNQVQKTCSVSTESPVIEGLTHSIHEEQAAYDIYEVRAKQAEDLGHPHVAALYRHIAGEERGHEKRFAIMREEVKKEKT